MEVLKVSSKSNPNSVAGAMAGVVRQSGAVEVQVVGAGALNQAVKAIAIARGYVAPSGVDLICVPTFADIEIDGESAGCRWWCRRRSQRPPPRRQPLICATTRRPTTAARPRSTS